MFRSSSVCLSALSKRTKRVKVQVLKDFPIFQLYQGEVTQVKPSFMRNYLHNSNGARYILQDSDIDMGLLQEFQERQPRLRSAKRETMAAKPEPSSKPEPSKNTPAAEPAPKKSKGILEKDITVKDVRIPGLDL